MDIRKSEKIAIIVSYSPDGCKSFCRHYGLNSEAFILVCDPQKLQGLRKDIPVIITDFPWSMYPSLLGEIKHRFDSVRIINY